MLVTGVLMDQVKMALTLLDLEFEDDGDRVHLEIVDSGGQLPSLAGSIVDDRAGLWLNAAASLNRDSTPFLDVLEAVNAASTLVPSPRARLLPTSSGPKVCYEQYIGAIEAPVFALASTLDFFYRSSQAHRAAVHNVLNCEDALDVVLWSILSGEEPGE